MKTTGRNSLPLLITACSLAIVCSMFLVGEATKDNEEGQFRLDIFDKLECITYDARVRMAAAIPDEVQPGKTLATMFIDDEAFERVNDGTASAAMAPAWDDGNLEGLEFGFPWPRFMYGQMIRELSAEGARAVGFDILFAESDRPSPVTDVSLDKTNVLSSDQFFAHEVAQAGNVILATDGGILPKPMFLDGAIGVGNIASRSDYGVLRRVRAYGEYKVWHPAVDGMVKALNLKLKTASFTNEPGYLVIQRIDKGKSAVEDTEASKPFRIPLLKNGNLMLTKDGSINVDKDVNDMGPDDQPPFVLKKAWNLGLALAATQLGLDLDKAVVEPDRIILSGTNGVSRVIATDRNHEFYIDWKLRWEDIKAEKTAVVMGSPLKLLSADFDRQQNGKTDIKNAFTNRLVIFGSVATGNNLTDMGSTPLEEKTPLVTKHLNVASSVIENRFIRRASDATTIALILACGAVAGLLTWRSKVVYASIGIAIISIIFIVAAFIIFIQSRYWVPIVMPVFGGLLLPHFCLVTYRVVFEQKEQRHLKGVFTKIVAPEVVNELLGMERLSLGGARREITVYFADVRGFTEFTDRQQKEADEYVKRHKLTPEQAEVHYDKQAKDTLDTVNLYLSTIADQIKKHRGTLDKYIGDCVMSFWGSPVPEAQHALCAVRAALDSQRAMYAVNQKRAEQNEKIKVENEARVARGEEPVALFPLLQLGSGINTGSCIVGLMGSSQHIFSYTVFGVEVNLASRLEGVSGRGRIIVSQRTYEHVKQFDEALAATFVELPAVTVKGISTPVRIYEVPWKLPEASTATAAAAKPTATPAEPAKA